MGLGYRCKYQSLGFLDLSGHYGHLCLQVYVDIGDSYQRICVPCEMLVWCIHLKPRLEAK